MASVTLKQFPRAAWAPNLSPFTVKLETYLRMAKIDYKNVFGLEMGPKSKTPFVEYKGKDIGDSQLIMELLNKDYNLDTMKHLSAAEKGIATAFRRLAEDNLFWGLLVCRWRYGDKELLIKENQLSTEFASSLQKILMDGSYAQGIIRHSEEEFIDIVKGDLRAISAYLGEKKFLMGEEPCDVDCAMFGQLAMFKWQLFCPKHSDLMDEFPNLHAYCDRMKETFWPDWDECHTHGGTKEATK